MGKNMKVVKLKNIGNFTSPFWLINSFNYVRPELNNFFGLNGVVSVLGPCSLSSRLQLHNYWSSLPMPLNSAAMASTEEAKLQHFLQWLQVSLNPFLPCLVNEKRKVSTTSLVMYYQKRKKKKKEKEKKKKIKTHLNIWFFFSFFELEKIFNDVLVVYFNDIFYLFIFWHFRGNRRNIYIYIFSFANYFFVFGNFEFFQLNRVELRGCEIKYCDSNKGFGIFYANDASDGK